MALCAAVSLAAGVHVSPSDLLGMAAAHIACNPSMYSSLWFSWQAAHSARPLRPSEFHVVDTKDEVWGPDDACDEESLLWTVAECLAQGWMGDAGTCGKVLHRAPLSSDWLRHRWVGDNLPLMQVLTCDAMLQAYSCVTGLNVRVHSRSPVAGGACLTAVRDVMFRPGEPMSDASLHLVGGGSGTAHVRGTPGEDGHTTWRACMDFGTSAPPRAFTKFGSYKDACRMKVGIVQSPHSTKPHTSLGMQIDLTAEGSGAMSQPAPPAPDSRGGAAKLAFQSHECADVKREGSFLKADVLHWWRGQNLQTAGERRAANVAESVYAWCTHV